MKSVRLFPSLLLSVALALLLALAARAEEIKSSIAFSQPDQPGTVKVRMARGSLVIQGADTAEVVVKSDSAPAAKTTRKDGLRVLTTSSSFSLTEKNNLITLDAMGDIPTGAAVKLHLTVPRNASVQVQNSWGGDVKCVAIGGNIEVTGTNGTIRLEEVSGGIVASTMNGEIHASVKELHEGKPLSFQSMNGEIVLRLPGAAKANLRVRTQNGSVLTDFDETALVTKTESTPGPKGFVPPVMVNGQSVFTPEAREAIREAARVGAEVVREAAVAIREAAEAAREGAEAARHGAHAARESAEAAAAAAAVEAASPKPPKPPTPARAPRAPKPMTMPTITGGKLVTGALNGGGAEINIATMNGDVTLRRIEKQ
jgi:hypothetical protein